MLPGDLDDGMEGVGAGPEWDVVEGGDGAQRVLHVDLGEGAEDLTGISSHAKVSTCTTQLILICFEQVFDEYLVIVCVLYPPPSSLLCTVPCTRTL